MKFWSLILIFLFASGCSGYQSSKNRVAINTISFKGGVKNQEKWEDTLDFKRTSWFSGATLSYDLILGELKKDSPFRKWLSESEALSAEKCEVFLIAMLYAYFRHSKSTATISSQIESMGFRSIALPVFSSYVKSHPTFPDRNIDNYRILGYCKEKGSKISQDRVLDVPGFLSTKLQY